VAIEDFRNNWEFYLERWKKWLESFGHESGPTIPMPPPPEYAGKTGATPYFLPEKKGSCTGFSGHNLEANNRELSPLIKDWSDIDLAIISPDFGDMFEERLELMRLAVSMDDRIEPHPFRPEEFNDNQPLASEIRRTGIAIDIQTSR
jgi:hypothetical protein